jgi:hypothetical protein
LPLPIEEIKFGITFLAVDTEQYTIGIAIETVKFVIDDVLS